MRNVSLIIIAALIVVGFLFFMTTYTVRFTDVAIVTTFGRAGENASVEDPGLKFKWPAPIQSTTIYDNRVRLLRTRDETQQTADQRQIVVGAFLTWRISDPLRFYTNFRGDAGPDPQQHYEAAEDKLEPIFRSAMSEVSRFRMSELFATGEDSRIGELERAILERLGSADVEGGRGKLDAFGIEVPLVGISSIEFPQEVTTQVFERMKSEREKLAADAEAEGEARAQAIRSSATDDAQRIMAFVGALAGEILARGETEAAQWLEVMDEEPQLAAFLERIDLMRRGFGKRVTLIFDTRMVGFELFDPLGLVSFFGDRPVGGTGEDDTPAEASTQ